MEDSHETGKNENLENPVDGSEVNIMESEDESPAADVDPGRTPGKAEGVEDPEVAGNE